LRFELEPNVVVVVVVVVATKEEVVVVAEDPKLNDGQPNEDDGVDKEFESLFKSEKDVVYFELENDEGDFVSLLLFVVRKGLE